MQLHDGSEIADYVPVLASTRKALGIQPLRAAKYLVLGVLNKPGSGAYARLIECTLHTSYFDRAIAFTNSPFGRELYTREGDVSDWIDDRSLWRDCGAASVARNYLNFMERQKTSARELRDLSRKWRLEDGWHNDRVEWYYARSFSLHDLTHVLFGYGFDAVGEMCVMECIKPHYPNFGMTVQRLHGLHRLARLEPRKGYAKAAIAEAERNGRKVPALWEQDIRELMRMNLSEARERLGIILPRVYEPLVLD